jgi:hypothetical protein
MSVINDSIKAMKKVLLLTDNVEKAGNMLSELALELRDHDRRLVRLETIIEIAKIQSGPKKLQ